MMIFLLGIICQVAGLTVVGLIAWKCGIITPQPTKEEVR
jgi:hypothetical protein